MPGPDDDGRRRYAVSATQIDTRRRTILEAAAEVIAGSGEAGCTLSAVSKASGCSVGMIQHHFGTRSELIVAAARQRIHESEQEWLAISRAETGPMERIRRLLVFAVHGERPFAEAWSFWLELYAAARRDAVLRQEINTALEVWRRFFLDVLEEAHAAGLVRATRPADRQAQLLLALVDGLALQAANETYGLTGDDMLALLFDAASDLLGHGFDS
ncbi:TetR/AcrR family transcriptional regulator [Zhihengliuella halotolerans]|uniref:TetR/AcrR family transcriptional regulator n=1 Tax=Zhihengliuella halotolerans TaxID=370736 RepID=UPI000C80D04D|nr:TetR/AcrR family transcriptional regulator [Zhihengliuella halotolerans]